MNSRLNGDLPQPPRGHSLRKGRNSLPNQVYLLTSVTQGREAVFADLRAARLLILAMKQLHDTQQVESLAFVVMPDHLHWLIQLRESNSLAQVMKLLKGRSARLINSYRQSSRPLWQPGFHDHALRDDEDVVQTARYVIANPLRAQLVKRIGDYPFWDAKWLL